KRLVRAPEGAGDSVRAYAFHAFVLAAILPVLLLAAVQSQLAARKQEAEGGARLREAVTALGNRIESYVDDHARAVSSLAAAMSRPDLGSSARQQLLVDYQSIYPGFIRLFATDGTGFIQQMYPLPGNGPPPPITDRKYFIEAVRTKRLVISDVI